MGYPIPVDLLNLSHDNWPLKFVSQVIPPTSMNDPDLIEAGRTASGLGVLWTVFLSTSLVVSAILASLAWPTFERELRQSHQGRQ